MHIVHDVSDIFSECDTILRHHSHRIAALPVLHNTVKVERDNALRAGFNTACAEGIREGIIFDTVAESAT